MALWIFEAKFSYDITIGEDGNLEMLAPGPTPTHHESIYDEATYYPADTLATSTLGGACLGLNPYAGSYTPTAML
jgi:hypothetical protein